MDVCIENVFPAVAAAFNSFHDEAREGKSHEQDVSSSKAIPNIVHVMIDDFFASVEQVLDPELRAKMSGDVPEAQIGMEIKQLTSPWFRYFLTYDPATALRKVTCPVLVLNGSLDKQVLPVQNLPPIRKALAEAGNKNVEIDELPGLNHLFQTAKTGAPTEYAQIEETLSPVALEKMATWIGKQQ